MEKYAKLMASLIEQKYPTVDEVQDIVRKFIASTPREEDDFYRPDSKIPQKAFLLGEGKERKLSSMNSEAIPKSIIAQLQKGYLHDFNIISLARENLSKERRNRLLNEGEHEVTKVLKLKAPMTIVGDLHGHFEDLITIFSIYGHPPMTSYLFLGNYVDKGHHSLFVILYLFCCKILYPNQVHLLRGAHESLSINELYGFAEECRDKYKNDRVWRTITKAYKYLSIAAVFEANRVFSIDILHPRRSFTRNKAHRRHCQASSWQTKDSGRGVRVRRSY